MQHIDAVLFDLDGTLIHSIDHIVDCWQHTVRTCMGREMSREEIVPTLGRALLECFEEIAPGRSAEMREVYRRHQQATHDMSVTLVQGTHEALEALRQAGMPLGVVTSKGIQVAMEGLNLFALANYFSVLVTYEDTERHKPDPDPLLVGCGRLGIEPERVIYVGDAAVDIEAGKAAGTMTAGVTWGAGRAAVIEKSEPDYIFNSMDELCASLVGHATART